MNKKLIFCFLTCLFMWIVLLSGWAHTYDTATPAGTDDPREADDRMREIKAAVQEIMDVEHDWTLTGTRLTGDGKHTDISCDSIIITGLIVDVTHPDYGAVGDGVIDDAIALQAAFDSGGSVVIPEGTYITNTPLTWTTDSATLQFVSHNSIIQAGATFPVDTPIILFTKGASDLLRYCSIYNLSVRCEGRASGITLTDCGHLSFYSPKIHGGKNGDDNYSFDVLASTQHSGTIFVYGLHIQGNDEGGGVRLEGEGAYVVQRCGFWAAHIRRVGHGIYLKSRCYGNHFEQMMIDVTYDNAGAFGIKEESGVSNSRNVFSNVIVESTETAGTGIDMQDDNTVSSIWDYWVVNFSTATNISLNLPQKENRYINGVQLRSSNRGFVLHGKFDGYSPDDTMTWGSVRSANITDDDTDDTWDFILPLPTRSIINTITNQFATDDAAAKLKMQVWKQSSELATWVQVGADHDFTGNGPHTATIDYEIEGTYVVKVSILAQRGAGIFCYVYPLSISADY